MWIFEPHVAEEVFEGFLREYQVPVHRDAWLDRAQGVKQVGQRIASITTLGGQTFAGRMFIDATYEGDLLAAAGWITTSGARRAASTMSSGTACRPACCTTAIILAR